MIDLMNLKLEIENNTFNRDVLVLVCKDDSAKFVANQYLRYYARKNNYQIEQFDELNDMFSMFTANIYVHHNEHLDHIPAVDCKLWIITEAVSKVVESNFENIVYIDKLSEWQIVDYVATTSHITEDQAKELIAYYKDINKLDIEIKKLQIFKGNKFDDLIDQLIISEERPIFDLVNALIKRDKKALASFIESGTEVDPFPLLAILLKNVRSVIDIQLAKNATAESLGMSSKQFWAISKYSCNHYNREELLYLYNVLTQIDSKIKAGDVDVSNVVNYIISNFLKFM